MEVTGNVTLLHDLLAVLLFGKGHATRANIISVSADIVGDSIPCNSGGQLTNSQHQQRVNN